MKNEQVSEGSIAKFTAHLTLYIGFILFIANVYYSVIEEYSTKGLMDSAIIFCTTLSVFSILIIASKLSNYLDKK
ncbi:MAG: hypothetical protein ACOYM7_05290 [Paludibacter sp.]